MSILVFCETSGGAFAPTAAEFVAKASELASALGTTVDAAVLGDAPAADLGKYGAGTVYQASGDFGTYDSGATTDALAAIIKASGATIVIGPSSYAGRDSFPRLTARFDGGMASDCQDLRVEGGALVARRPTFAGSIEVDTTVTAPVAFFTVRGNSFGQPESATGGAATVEAVSFERTTPSVEVVETLAPETKGVDLSTADIVVAGGRSLKSKENFDQFIRGLGEKLGAGVGASRAATDAGYADHAEQVGQTGQTVSPSLYFAFGISGAIQHLAGMRSSKVIVAVNKDADAPIFEHATYGIVADLFDIIPALNEALD